MRARPGGFTAIEMVVALALGGLILGNVLMVLADTRERFAIQDVNKDVDAEARHALDRIALQIMGAVRQQLYTQESAPLSADSINYTNVIGVQNGEPVVSSLQRIAMTNDPSGSVTWYENPGQQQEKRVDLEPRPAQLLRGRAAQRDRRQPQRPGRREGALLRGRRPDGAHHADHRAPGPGRQARHQDARDAGHLQELARTQGEIEMPYCHWTCSTDARRGSALLPALLAVMLTSALCISYMQLSLSKCRESQVSVDAKRAFYVAEAGLAEAYYGLARGLDGSVGSPDQPARFGTGVYWVTAEDHGEKVTLRSTGLSGLGRAAVSTTLRKAQASVGSLGLHANQTDQARAAARWSTPTTPRSVPTSSRAARPARPRSSAATGASTSRARRASSPARASRAMRRPDRPPLCCAVRVPS